MKYAICLALVLGGFVLLGFGLEEADSFQSQTLEFFTGQPTEEALGLLVSGTAVVALGLVGIVVSLLQETKALLSLRRLK